MNYVIFSLKTWNKKAYENNKHNLVGNWFFYNDKKFLNEEHLDKIKPQYIFFPHWSLIIPENIYLKYTCILFHMTNLPYGRGGSPLQNLISRGFKKTLVSAISVQQEVDSGDIYCQEELLLKGNAQKIYEKMADITIDLIRKIINGNYIKKKQTGKITFFKRRVPKESVLPKNGSIEKIYDHIRMLDAETYPLAFINHGNLKVYFSKAKIKNNMITVKAKIEVN